MTSLSNVEVDSLIIDLQCGGEARKRAVTQLYIAFATKITQFLTLRGVPFHEAEDVLHEIFISLIARAGSFTPMGQGRGWVWTVVRSKLADRYRSSQKMGSHSAGDDVVSNSNSVNSDFHVIENYGEEGYDEDRLKSCIEGQMAAFTRDHPEGAQALSWVMDDDLDLRSISELLGRSYGATREFMSQIRSKLKVYIDSCLAD
ncbi:RNA polymerase sigma factor [Zhongshania sp. BJYM1]|uniref:RNA polymerase sigma factor n=1 Tax=Zhongshania aquatica TaxID=2965069 RepID=UPI0022B3DD1C|nr:sigma-70 family RNA polymerase sigma factor [Marortus sp. BJYM1]